MQNQNIWTGSFSSGCSEKGCNTSENPDSDEGGNLCIGNSVSQPAEHIIEIFSNCDSDNITADSIHNMASVTDPSHISSTSTDIKTVEKNAYDEIFSNSSSLIESQHSSLLSCKYSDETHLSQINGQMQSEAVPSSELCCQPDKTVSSMSSVQRCSKRRNSLPSDYPNYKRRLSVDYEVQSLCNMDGSDSNSSCDINRHSGNEESSWTNCYAPYRKRPTSVVSSERSESLLNKLFSEDEKKRFEALGKKSAKRMDSKRRKNKHVNFCTVYKSFVEGVTHPKTDITFEADKKYCLVNKPDIKILESISDGHSTHAVSTDTDSKDFHQVMFTSDSIPEETEADFKSETDNITVDTVSYQQDIGHIEFDSIDNSHTSENVLIQVSQNDGCTVVDDNSKDSHVMSATDSIPEEADSNLVSVNLVSNQQDAILMDCDDDGQASENILVLHSSDESTSPKVSVDTIDVSKYSQQVAFITDTMPEKTRSEIESDPSYLAVHSDSTEQDVVSVSCDVDGLTSENVFTSVVSPASISADIDDNSEEVILVADSVPKGMNTDVISESDSLIAHVNSSEQDVLTDLCTNEHTSEHVLVSDVSSDIVSTDIDNNSKDSHGVNFIVSSPQNEMNVISKSDDVTFQTDSNQQVEMATDSVTDVITTENVVSSDAISVDAGDNSKDSQQVIFIADSIPEGTHSQIILESDGLVSHINSNEQHVFTIGSDADQITSEEVYVYVACEDGYRLCKVSTNSDDSQQITFITNETDGGLIADSNCYIINSDSSQQDVVTISYTTSSEDPTSENIIVPTSEVLFETVPLDSDNQNIDLKVESNESQFYNPLVDKGSAGNLTTDEISDSLDKIFTQTAESGVLYSIPEEQKEVPFDFDGEKLISVGKNVSNVTTENTYSVIPEVSEENVMHVQLENPGTKTLLNSEVKENRSSAEYYLESKEIVLVEEKQNVSVENFDRNPQIDREENVNVYIDLGSGNTEKVFKIQPNNLGNIKMEICHEEGKVFGDKASNEIRQSIFAETCIENSMNGTFDLKYQNNNMGMEFCVKPQISSYKCRTSKARKSTSNSSDLNPSENEVLKVIENNIDNEAFNMVESKENSSSHGNLFLSHEQVSQNLPTLTYTLSNSEAENIPLIEGNINFNTNLEMNSIQNSKSSFRAHFNGKHKNGTAKKSCSQIGNRSSDEMSNNCDMQNSVASSDSESSDKASESRKNTQCISDYNNSDTNNPISSFSVVEDLSILHNRENATQRTALKTFKKPFTVAKKSVTDKSSFKTVFQSYFGIRTAKKTCNKSSNKKLLNANLDESSSSVEELSADEARNSTVIWSPVKDLQLKVCSCSAVEIPCLCNGERLQSICEAEDTIDEKIVPCTKSISQQYLLTPSAEIKHRAFCDIHLWRLKNHHCCPKCGIFCTQGSFLCCSYDHPVKGGKETHFFHPNCFLVPDTGLPPGCPHCCTFSNFKNVHFSLTEKVLEETLTQSSNNCTQELNITQNFENYAILMKTQIFELETISKDSTNSIPQTQDLKTMLVAITKEPALRLRPTGKCLFNPIKVGDVKKVILLIANGVDPNHKFNQHKNNTPLHIAAFYGSIGIVHILIQYGASIDAVNDDLETPFILAVEKNQMAVARYLIHAGAEIDVKNENGLTAFHVACKNNSKEMAEFLFNSGKFDINLNDDGGWTPLVWACEHNYGNLVQWLLEHGADPNIHDNEQNTALHWAACSGNSDILEMLLDNGCNLCFVNQRGDSALHIAARKDNWACVKLLLAKNALLDCANKDGETPIMCCDEDSKSLRILNKHALTSTISDYKSFQQYVVYRDISRGSEKYPIQAVNEVDQEEFIMDFRYITQNCYASNITVISTVDSMQKCYCKDNCNSSDCTCTSISKCWYDMDRCLISDFDMYDPPSLYECNKTCHCPKTCINRVVQKGLRHPLQLFRTFSRGWGIRSLKDLARGTFVCEYVGEVISEEEINQRTDDTYLFDLESKTGDNCIDGRFYGNIARFINHSCEPNLISIRVFIEHQDSNFPRIAFFTMKDIKAFEELCFDYGTEFWVAKSQTVLCTCNSESCKYSKDSIDATLQAYIQEKEEQASSPMDLQIS